GLTVIAILANPSGPLGGFWRPAAGTPAPAGLELPFGLLLKIAEGLAFGAGISFLVFGYPLVRAGSSASPALTRAAHVAIAWLLINWWPHDSLHIHNGLNLGGLLAIEYAFHITLMIAGVVLVRFFLAQVQSSTKSR
ncbi:MAG: hypothetical protein ABI847_13010, partial [Anaerolineales bacterium]